MGARVLVVDDERMMQRLFTAILEEFGYTAHCVAQAADAEAALRTSAYCGMILDYQLPGEDGVTFMLRVADVVPVPPTIIVTGHNITPLQQRSLPAYVRTIMAKPIELQALAAATRAYFGPPEGQAEHETGGLLTIS
jgi:DNA-binding response OmpR family regulator